MITQRLHFMENGNQKTMIVRYRIKDFKNSFIFKKLGIDDPRWYVEYNRYDKSSLFDSSAPTWYVRLAAIFENISWDSVLTTSPDYILRQIGEETILVPVVSEGPLANTMMTMNDTACWLWNSFAKGASSQDVLKAAIREYDDGTADHKAITEGVYRFVLESLALGTLIPKEDAS